MLRMLKRKKKNMYLYICLCMHHHFSKALFEHVHRLDPFISHGHVFLYVVPCVADHTGDKDVRHVLLSHLEFCESDKCLLVPLFKYPTIHKNSN